jgi:type IV pilus assembly protein PilX
VERVVSHSIGKLVRTSAARAHAQAQRGVSLIFALLALAAVSLAAVALVRSVDSGALVIGNLGFKQDATASADRAVEVARRFLIDSTNLVADVPSMGYYASAQDNLDPTGRLTTASNPMAVVRWDSDSCACESTTPASCASCSRIPRQLPALENGVTASYIITRMCPSPGAVTASNACAQPVAAALSGSSEKGELTPGKDRLGSVVQQPYFRIIVRTVGGRNTVSFTETVIY